MKPLIYVIKAVRVLDRLDPGWQSRPYTLRMLGLAATAAPQPADNAHSLPEPTGGAE